MGTTLVTALARNGTVSLGHVGDSRAYLCSKGSLTQVTNDHSWVNEQVFLGLLTREEAAHHPFRNVITRALGSREEVAADLTDLPFAAGDRLLLCSDGLTTMLDDREILEALERHAKDLEACAADLVERANRAGGEDNVTVVLASLA